MKKLILPIVLFTISAFGLCQKEIIHVEEKRIQTNDGLGSLLGAGQYEETQDSIYFRNGENYWLFVTHAGGTIKYYRQYRKGYDLYECRISSQHSAYCKSTDENGVIVKKETFKYDYRTSTNPLYGKLRDIYKKVKAICSE